jgi:hypothetical protein
MLRKTIIAALVIAGAHRSALSQSGSDLGPDITVLSADELFSDPEVMTDGLNVRLEDCVVRAKPGNMLRVRVAKHEIFVVPPDPAKLDFIAIGAHVHLQGTLRKSPSASQARLQYAMRTSDARRLARTHYYVEAWALTMAD